ncbi:MAG: tetratricopeptide repeat protein [Opitutaceae bacterium]|nr:tetratricopeptide repeat protein [Opitutaceae bacterium]
MARSPRVSPPPVSSSFSGGGEVWLGLLLFAATLVTYLPALRGGFIWNDSEYVTAPALRSVEGFWRIWFELGATEQFYPLLHSAFWLGHRLWGDHPFGYHLVNVLQHATAACLLALVLRRLAIPGPWLAAFVFALHPVMVESVAWISEQKNTLSLVFYLAAALVYLRFDTSRSPRAYAYATLLFVGALLTKTVTASLPAALLVVVWWQRGRIDVRRDVGPLLPWFVLGAAMGLLSAHVERVYIGAQGEEFGLDGLQRSLLAGRIAWFYAAKLFWPAELIFIYPRWQVDPAQVGHWLFSLGALALLAGLWCVRQRSRAPLAAVLFFGGSLFPTLGFFNVYAFLYSFVADHWQYLPSIGLLVLASAGLARLLAARGVARAVRVGLPVVIVSGLGLLSFQQSRMYVDLRTFYVTTLARNPAAWMAHNNLGNLLREAGELDAARGHFEAALRVRPDLYRVHNNLANVLRAQRQPAEAERHYRRAIELRPDYAEAHNNLGSLLRQTGRPAEAMRHLFAAIRADPAHADARNNLGMTLRDLERNTDAILQFQRALRLQPDMAAAHLNLALSLSLAGRSAEAGIHLREARRLNPRIPDLRLD